jgi:hypothetical protein
MHQTAHFVAITDESLAKAPASVQEYVKEFFKRTEVLGKDCWVAFIGSVGQGTATRSHRNRGVAHNHWRRGLWEESRKFLAENPTGSFDFYANWDDGCVGPEPD